MADLAASTVRVVSAGVEVDEGAWNPGIEAILTPAACDFLESLVRRFAGRREELLGARVERQAEFDRGALPGYENPHSEAVTSLWTVRPIPRDLQQRRVEITGPVNNRKMVINMLSRNERGHRADCAMLDFEDSMMPSWSNVIDGMHNLIGAAKGELVYHEVKPDGTEKRYALDPDDMPVIMVRARGLHLLESNCRLHGKPVSASLFDLALSAFHSARLLVAQGKTPKYYIPKVEHYLEARWWDDLFAAIEDELDLPRSTLRATFLIETLNAAFQMEEILFELRDHAAGLNVGRWDKIFSDIKTLRAHPERIMGDRGQIDMSKSWMRDYAKRLVHICHRHGAFALGGMAAFTPGKTAERRREQMDKVIADKQLESELGHDGCWVSHPFFIGEAQSQFPIPNQLHRYADEGDRFPDLLPRGGGPRTMDGLRTNIRVGIAYLRGWQSEIGCVAWDDLMEDLATLEISRAQVWQWLHHQVRLQDGQRVTPKLVARVFAEEFDRIVDELGLTGEELDRWQRAQGTAKSLFTQKSFQEFLTDRSPRKTHATGQGGIQ